MLDVADLTEPERQLLDAAAAGRLLDLRPGRAGTAPAGPTDAKVPIRGSVQVSLLTEDLPDGVAAPLAVRIRGAKITGNLNLGGRTLRCPVELRDCHLGGRVSLALAEAPSVSFRGSTLRKGLSARRVRIAHVLNLSGGFTARAQVSLSGAQLGGALLSGARLVNPNGNALNLDNATITGDLLGNDGFIARGEVRLIDAHISGIVSFSKARLLNAHGNALFGDRATITGSLFCRDGFVAHGEVCIVGTQIGGQADFSSARLLNPGGYAMSADGATITGDLSCRDGFVAHGEVCIVGTQIGGQADFSGARLLNPGGYAMSADRATITGGFFCRDGFVARGQVRLIGAQISGQAVLAGARVLSPNSDALSAEGATITDSLFCTDGFVARGQVRLSGAQISGQADFSGARLLNPDGDALSADGTTITGSLFCRDGFVAHGQIRLIGAQISGQADLARARLLNPGGNAMSANRATITEDLFCDNGFVARGEVRLSGVRIGGQADFSGARLFNPDGDALSADGATITDSLLCGDGFVAHGQIRLSGAQISGHVEFSEARLLNPGGNALSADHVTITEDLFCANGSTVQGQLSLLYAHIGKDLNLDGAVLHGDGDCALDLERATVGTRFWLRCQSIDGGIVDATGANVGHLDDDPTCWPAGSLFAGLTYRSICDRGDDFTPARRAWVRRHGGGYAPDVYDQLANTYRDAGHPGGARTVLIAKQSARRSQPLSDRTAAQRAIRPFWRAARAGWSWLLRWTIGYGYAPWRSLWWLVPAYLVGWLGIFRRIGPSDLTALHHGEVFHPALYTLDLLVPVVSLKQRDAWAVHGGYEWWAAVYTAIGWLAATIIAAGLAGVFKRD